MPQFNIADAIPQIVWLALIFFLLYLSMAAMLPRVEKVVSDRRARIAADVAAAEAARAAAQAASSGGGQVLGEARARAMAMTGEARAKAQQAMSARLAMVDAELERKAAESEALLESARQSALAALEQVATDATVDTVARVAGVHVAANEAADAVHQVAA